MILVTGATGKTGREIVRQLRGAGARVRALVRDRAKAEALAALAGVELVEGDLGRPETLDAALAGADAALLLSSPEPHSVELQINFVEAARRASTPRLVKLSALGADAAAPEGFYRWHGRIERALGESGLPHTNLRPTVFMQEILNSWARQSVIRLPMADARVAAVDIRDIAAVAVKTLTEGGHENRSYPITGPESLTFREIAAKISDATGEAVTYENVTPSPLACPRVLRPRHGGHGETRRGKEILSDFKFEIPNLESARPPPPRPSVSPAVNIFSLQPRASLCNNGP
ncbi:MAG: NAD(P)H-binding protein [Acidobacteria bacterium]|nr:NAD(P)H-binding protein [Acidobacteriota bacterium]